MSLLQDFAMEILRKRIAVPPCRFPNSLLARHERSLTSSLQARLTGAASHLDQSVDTTVLPLCQSLIEAIGTRLAYEAAIASLQGDILDLFVASNFKKDPAWYALNEGLDGGTQSRMETEAAKRLLPHIDMLLEMLEVEPYVVAPIVSDERWNCYVDRLDTYGEMPIPTRSVISEIPSGFFVSEVPLTVNYDHSQADSLLIILWIFRFVQIVVVNSITDRAHFSFRPEIPLHNPTIVSL